MKLLQKANITYILFSMILFLIVGISLYVVLYRIINKEVSEKLIVNKNRIVKQIEIGDSVTSVYPILMVKEIFIPVKENIIIKDTSIFDPIENEPESFLEITAIQKINGKSYQITVRQVIIESHDYYNTIGLTLLIAFVFLLIGLILINRYISKQLWQPFYKNLKQLKKFSIQNNELVNFHSSNIREFEELKDSLIMLTSKVLSDFQSLKEFSENASHEMQTPIAIIKNKIETLLNTNNLSKEQLESLNSVDEILNRLMKLNKGLVLLTKIENQQFNEKESIDLNEIISEAVSEFSELIKLGDLNLNTCLKEMPKIKIDKSLVRIMISNLISNAIKFTPPGGIVEIETNKSQIIFSNTSKSEAVDETKIFNRFYKNKNSPNSIGLGLAIVKKICETNNLIIKYNFQNQIHFFTIQL